MSCWRKRVVPWRWRPQSVAGMAQQNAISADQCCIGWLVVLRFHDPFAIKKVLSHSLPAWHGQVILNGYKGNQSQWSSFAWKHYSGNEWTSPSFPTAFLGIPSRTVSAQVSWCTSATACGTASKANDPWKQTQILLVLLMMRKAKQHNCTWTLFILSLSLLSAAAKVSLWFSVISVWSKFRACHYRQHDLLYGPDHWVMYSPSFDARYSAHFASLRYFLACSLFSRCYAREHCESWRCFATWCSDEFSFT